jgi:hypothetical protein
MMTIWNRGRRWLAALLLAAGALAVCAAPSWAFVDCSGTVGTTSQPLLYGGSASQHLEITNPAQNTNNICVRPGGGTAVCGAAGTVTIIPGGDKWWDFPDMPGSPSIIASGSGTPFQCDYQ